MSSASLHNDFGELDKMQVNIQGVAHDLRQIERVDSRLYSNEDTQRVMQELGSTRTDNNSFPNFVSSRWVYYIKFKTCLYFDFHWWVHELLMSLKTWASGEVPRASKIWGLFAQRARWNSNIFRALDWYGNVDEIEPISTSPMWKMTVKMFCHPPLQFVKYWKGDSARSISNDQATSSGEQEIMEARSPKVRLEYVQVL